MASSPLFLLKGLDDMAMMKNLITGLAETLVMETGCSFDYVMELLMDGHDFDECYTIIMYGGDSK